MVEIKNIQTQANEIRKLSLAEIYNAQSGHPGGALSIADIMATLYFKVLNVNPKNPKWEDRDRFVLSKGHTCAALYAALALRGFFYKEELYKFRSIDSFLEGHPALNKVPGVDMSTGSLGQGLSAANGMALAGKIDKKKYRVYAIVGDGELDEGQIWEAALTSAHYRLNNLCVVVDLNRLQIDGRTSEVKNTSPIDSKFEAFGWNVIRIDGHDIEQIIAGFEAAESVRERPTVIIASTVKGKGVSFMENQAGWHGKAPNEEEYKKAIEELELIGQAIR